MRYSEEEIIDELVDEFGEEYRDEIEETFDTENWIYYDYDYGEGGGFTVDGDEYVFFTNEEYAKKTAIEYVVDEIKLHPENFDLDFMARYITISRLAINKLIEDLVKAHMDEFIEQARKEVKKVYADKEGINIKKEIDERVKEIIDEFSQEVYKELWDDPVNYYMKKIGLDIKDILKLDFVFIDYRDASEDAVNTDGWEQFLATYDGKYNITKKGVVYFRV